MKLYHVNSPTEVSELSIGGAMKVAQKTPKSVGTSAARKTNRSGKGSFDWSTGSASVAGARVRMGALC